jgi:hypothetical protein
MDGDFLNAVFLARPRCRRRRRFARSIEAISAALMGLSAGFSVGDMSPPTVPVRLWTEHPPRRIIVFKAVEAFISGHQV